jgi:DNA-binding transcriptional MerR regulator
VTTGDLFQGHQEPVARKEYYSVGEVVELTGLKPHVLRYWETQFDTLKPGKNRAGKRVYRPADVEIVFLLRRLLHEERYTLEGARLKLEELRDTGTLDRERREAVDRAFLGAMKDGLREIMKSLTPPTGSSRPD